MVSYKLMFFVCLLIPAKDIFPRNDNLIIHKWL